MEAQSPYLFVYGTLMRDFENPFATKLRAGATFIAEGFFPGELYRLSWYPGAVYGPESATKVYGEIYQLHYFQRLIQELDDYEDVKEREQDSLYIRRPIPIRTENGAIYICSTYLYNQSLDNATLLTSGKFTA